MLASYNIAENIFNIAYFRSTEVRSNNQWVWKGYFVNIARVAIPYYYSLKLYCNAPNQLLLIS
jgi:hypothetical protein